MLINAKKIITLPVYTKSGQFLGEVTDIEIDSDGQMVINYFVGSAGVIKKLFVVDSLVVHRSQIVSISNEKIIVEDNVAKKIEETLIDKQIGMETSETVVTSNSFTQK
ncbi:MAG: PRC-barrel domain-containing protein [Patescibacteria group bacterium]